MGDADRARWPSLPGLGDDVAGRPASGSRRSWALRSCVSGGAHRPAWGRRYAGSYMRPRPTRSPGTYGASRSCDRGSQRSTRRGVRRCVPCSTASSNGSHRSCSGCAPRSCTTTWPHQRARRRHAGGHRHHRLRGHDAHGTRLRPRGGDGRRAQRSRRRSASSRTRSCRGTSPPHRWSRRRSNVLADLIAGRYAAAILITAWRTRQQGSAPEIGDEAYRQLEAMLDVGLDTLTAGFTARGGRPVERTARRSRCALPPPIHDGASSRALAPAGRAGVSYAHPVHLVGGRGMFLEGQTGAATSMPTTTCRCWDTLTRRSSTRSAHSWPRSTPTAATCRRHPSSWPNGCWPPSRLGWTESCS